MKRLFSCVLLGLVIFLTGCGGGPSNGDIEQAIKSNLESPRYTFIKIEKIRRGNSTNKFFPVRVIALIKDDHGDEQLAYFEFKFVRLDADFGAKIEAVKITGPAITSTEPQARSGLEWLMSQSN
jgi:hypothetical protein